MNGGNNVNNLNTYLHGILNDDEYRCNSNDDYIDDISDNY
jgi:hypothetical protein